MICEHCGAELDDDLSFCPSCGARLAPLDEDEPDSELVMLEPDAEYAPDDPDEIVEYERYEGYATFMPIEQGSDAGIDVDPDELAGLEPIAVRDLGEDEAATTRIGPEYQIDAEPVKSHRGLKIFLTVFIIALVVVGAVCGVGYYKYKDRIAHEDVTVHVALDVPGYPAGEGSSSIPVRVAGMDLDGNTVDERMYIEDTKADIVLKRGEYQVSAVGTPVTGEGAIYRYPKRSVGIVVDETGVHAKGAGGVDGAADGGKEQVSGADAGTDAGADAGDSSASFMGEKVHLAYEQIAPERISDAMIDDAVSWMADSEADAPRAETLKAAITKARDDRLAEMEAEKKALEKQRREEELKSALASNPSSVDSTKREWSFTGTVVVYEDEYEVDGTMRFFRQYALEIPEETSFDIVSADDEKKLAAQEEAAKKAEEKDESGDDEKAAEDGDDAADAKAEADDESGDADEEKDEEPKLVKPVKSTKVIVLETLDGASRDAIGDSAWAEHVGKTVTVKGKLAQSITETPDNIHSQIHFVEPRAVKVFEEIEENE